MLSFGSRMSGFTVLFPVQGLGGALPFDWLPVPPPPVLWTVNFQMVMFHVPAGLNPH